MNLLACRVSGEIAVVRLATVEEEHRPTPTGDRVDGDLASRQRQGVERPRIGEARRVLHEERRRGVADVPREGLLRSEGNTPNPRVNPVGSHQEVAGGRPT